MGGLACAQKRRRRMSLLGRAQECAVLDGLIDDVRRGESRSLVLRGEAGIGKTALLEYLVESASDLAVVRAVGEPVFLLGHVRVLGDTDGQSGIGVPIDAEDHRVLQPSDHHLLLDLPLRFVERRARCAGGPSRSV